MPPTCDELTFRIYVPNTFQKNQVFGPQAGARLLKRVVFGTDDAMVRNDEVVGSIPTSSTIFSTTYKRPQTKSCHSLSQFHFQKSSLPAEFASKFPDWKQRLLSFAW